MLCYIILYLITSYKFIVHYIIVYYIKTGQDLGTLALDRDEGVGRGHDGVGLGREILHTTTSRKRFLRL